MKRFLIPASIAAAVAVLALAAVVRHDREGVSTPSTSSGQAGSPGVLPARTPSEPSAAEARFAEIDDLVSRGPDAVPEIAGALENADTVSDKEKYADALIGIGTADAIQAYAENLIAEPNPEHRKSLAESLKGLESDEGLEMVTSMLGLTRDPVVIGAVNDTLSRMADGETVAFLSEWYDEGATTQDGLQSRVLEATEAIQNPESVDALVALIETADHHAMALAAAESLVRMGDEKAILGLVEAIRVQETTRELYEPLLEELSSIADPKSEGILAAIAESDPSDAIRAAASASLVQIESGAELTTTEIRSSSDLPPFAE